MGSETMLIFPMKAYNQKMIQKHFLHSNFYTNTLKKKFALTLFIWNTFHIKFQNYNYYHRNNLQGLDADKKLVILESNSTIRLKISNKTGTQQSSDSEGEELPVVQKQQMMIQEVPQIKLAESNSDNDSVITSTWQGITYCLNIALSICGTLCIISRMRIGNSL